MSGTDDFRGRVMREILTAKSQFFLDDSSEKGHTSLSPDLEHIVRNTRARLVDWDSHDVTVMAIINNTLALKIKPLLNALRCDDALAVKQKIAPIGWHASSLTKDDLLQLHERGGYGFLLEYRDEHGATPYGMQIGFPFAPKEKHYPNLSTASLPQLDIYRDSNKMWTIWRTGILNKIDDVRVRYGQLGIPISPNLDDKVLHRIGAGQATKLIDAVAAVDLQKTLVQCNIGVLIRAGETPTIVAENEASIGSNGEIFERSGLSRSRIDFIEAKIGNEMRKIIEILWYHFQATPEDLQRRILRNEGALVKKGWDIDQLIMTGHALATELQSPE